ncbi:tetratricopeptide repeat protein [Pseudomonas aeruginosa]|uniref:tetratricopeptide repeat protein n=2 Tax=Pseudomonas aeruginosa TaxID=287 RepID=UPI00209186F6|nr:tetratricopeptide repeat protein [Pseudomonas aeruginosa]MBX5891427.1 sel1 repeat family protein [Pseudomonas aeruginosa]MCO5369436.1 sel1 repeat family protein [Pseudomonas aeruginosa]MCV0281249.1 sel1 repeat family protein [Pseudomonas aeruginosa]MDP5691356.1 tetratricopeptide repeat protein [Pseudomonas aeruginosa]MDV8090095.1 tetratricopeptide repeat protein [Pseudomonas aeruginosa]
MRISIYLFTFLLSFGVSVMADSKSFVCVNEKDHLPPLDSQADAWYREAAALAKPDTLRPWGRIVELYSKAVERGHWKAMHNLANLYRTGWPGGVEKDTQKALDLYQKMIDLKIPQGFYNMGAMIGNRAGVNNPATDGLTFLDKAASLGNPPALTELGKLYIYVAKNRELGLAYTQCAASQGYAPANYELGSYCELVEHNFPKAARYYLLAASQGNDDAALFMSGVFDKTSPDVDRMWYSPDEKLHKEYYSIYKKLEADPDLRFPNLMKEHPLPPHPTQGYDADRPDWKPEQ